MKLISASAGASTLSAFLLVFLAACGDTVLIDTAPASDGGTGVPTADAATSGLSDGGAIPTDAAAVIPACPAATSALASLGATNNPTVQAIAVDQAGNVAFTYQHLSDGQNRLAGFNVSNPGDLRALASPDTGIAGIAPSVAVEGGVAYFVSGSLRKVGILDKQPPSSAGVLPAGLASLGAFSSVKNATLFGAADNGTDNGKHALFMFRLPSEISALTHEGVALTGFTAFDKGFVAAGTDGTLFTGLEASKATSLEPTQGKTVQLPLGVMTKSAIAYVYWTARQGGTDSIVRTVLPSLDPVDRSAPAPIETVASSTDAIKNLAVLDYDDLLVTGSCRSCVRRSSTMQRHRGGVAGPAVSEPVAGDGIDGHVTDDISALVVRNGCAYWAEQNSTGVRIYWRKL